jgi:hypothetical protein
LTSNPSSLFSVPREYDEFETYEFSVSIGLKTNSL